MRFYIGYPLKWPSGEVFGTICVLDRERNDHALLFREGLAGVRPASSRRTCGRWSRSPNAGGSKPPCSTRSTRPPGTWSNAPANCRTPTRRCACCSAMSRQSNEARNEQLLLTTINTPGAAACGESSRGSWSATAAAVEYVRLIETNLQTLTSSLSSRMARVFQALTATEAEVAHLVMRGLTTKDIAATLSRAPSTIDFHRHNIRGKLGVERRVTLRAYLLSIR